MFTITIFLMCMCITSYVNCATLPNIEVHQDILDSSNKLNEIDSNDIPNICTTDTCAKESAILLDSLDENVNPCEDFYEFACGNYIRKIVLPDDKAVDLSFLNVQDKVAEQLRLILTEEPLLNESHPFKLAKEFNKICMDEAVLNEQGITPMVNILNNYGGWPVVKGNEWKAENWNWFDIKKQIVNDGLVDDIIFEFAVRSDLRNSSKAIIYIDRPEFGLSEIFLLKGVEHPKVKAYYEFMVDAAVIFGASKRNAKLELLDVLQFETDLAKISLSIEDRRNVSVLMNKYNISELQTAFPYVKWLEYINCSLYYNSIFNESEIVIVPDQNYMLQLNDLLQSTPKRTIANYFAWRLVLFSADLLNDILHQRNQKFLAATTGVLKSDPRLTECVKRTTDFLSISAGATYVRKFFNEESKKAANTLAQSIHQEFIKSLKNVDWMDARTRAAAIGKAKAMNFHIAYSDELIDNNKLEEYYSGLELQSDSLLHSVLHIRKFNRQLDTSQLRQIANKTDWRGRSTKTTKVDAFYSVLDNTIMLPAAILQDRFFSADRPSYMNFGAIGWFIGHEITHGFDDNGRQYDLNGNLVDWWDKDTEAEFTSKAQCFIDEYSNFTHPTLNLTVNGLNTQGENIADNGGIKAAYTAYQTFIQQNGPDQILAGLNYTANQLFWISAAQLWCAVTRPEFDTLQYATNPHSPFNYRIIGAFRNSRNFASDFNCTPNSRMNPVDKCEIW